MTIKKYDSIILRTFSIHNAVYGMRQMFVPVFIMCAVNLISAFFSGFAPIGNAVISGVKPGILEEVIFRGICIIVPLLLIINHSFDEISLYEKMNCIKDMSLSFRNKAMILLWATSVLFGSIHLINSFSGADVLLTVIQMINAVGISFMFGAVLIRTGNLLAPVIAHSLIDISAFLIREVADNSGILAAEFSPASLITVVFSTMAFAAGFRLVKKEHAEEIFKVWIR